MNWKQKYDQDITITLELINELKAWRAQNSTNTERARLLAKQLELQAVSLQSCLQTADIDRLLKEQGL